MNRQSILRAAVFSIALIFALAIPQIARGEAIPIAQGMGGGWMRGGDGAAIHQLFANHERVRRTVEEISGGVRTVTESDSPPVAALIQEHVFSMYRRIESGRGIPTIGMSSTLPVMARNPDLYRRQFEMTPKGIMVTETSDDPDMVAVIREHAREVTEFVETGMPRMMHGRMRSR